MPYMNTLTHLNEARNSAHLPDTGSTAPVRHARVGASNLVIYMRVHGHGNVRVAAEQLFELLPREDSRRDSA